MINNVVLMGRIAQDLELKNTNTGKEVTNFSIAVERAYSKGEEKVTDFINIVAWEKSAAFVCKYFKKGQMIAIEGELQTRSYEDSEGKKRTVYEVLARHISFCGSASETAPKATEDDGDDDFPF